MTVEEITAQVLDLAGRALKGAEIEVTADHRRSALTRFANSCIHQNVAEDTTVVGLRAHVDGRTVAVTTTLADYHALVDRVVATAGAAPRDPGWPGLAPPHPLTTSPSIDEATAGASAADRARIVHDFVQAVEGLEAAGYCRTVHWTGSYRNSAGQVLGATAASADMDGIARRGGADGVARHHSVRLSDLDGAALGARAAASARSQADPVELPPGRYEVVLRPEAVADILDVFSYHGFNGRFHNNGISFAEPGSQQFDEPVSIYDDPFAGVGAKPFDHEGTARSRLTLVDKGSTRTVAHDRRSAAAAGARSTGHALAGENWGPKAPNLAFAAGSTTLDQMITATRRGLLVSDLWYTRVLDPRTLVITGLTRNGVWLIENGEVIEPVRDLRFTQAYVQALGPGRVRGIGQQVDPQPNRRELSAVSCPALHLADWNFTGGASG